MFKRANKITSLLVAAAAVVSIVPASAADVKKIDSQDGTVYNAVAYKDGTFYVDGEVEDKDEAAYYVSDGDYTQLDDIDSGSDIATFGEKYLDVEDGDYTVDLDKGSVTDDDIVSDTADDAASALRKKIKEDTEDRYDENLSDEIKDENELDVIPGAKFVAPWYATTYAAAAGSTANDSATSFNVYTDTDGNYIDADYNLGKIKVKTTDGSVTIENTNDFEDLDSTNNAVNASVSDATIIGQDADYIYRLATVTVSTNGNSEITEINGKEVGADTVFGAQSDEVSYKVIQKISKAQNSDDVDGANYAKTVTTYTLSNDKAKAISGLDVVEDANVKFTVLNGKVIAYVTDDTDQDVTVRAYTLKASNGFYYTDEEDESSEDCEVSDDQGAAVQVDADGNLWRLDGGYIYKFDGTDSWNKVYKVDGSLDEMSVYDQDNMIAWCEDDEVYSVIGGKEAKTTDTTGTTDTTPVVTPVVTTGWAQATDGTWTYNKADGTKATGWLQLGGVWYYLKADGVMATGWVNDGGTWYYLAGSGAMATGWVNDGGTWYYLNANGSMAANTTVNGYVLGANGAWVR